MTKILKVFMYLCLFAIVLGALSAFALVALVNPNHYKQQISMQVHDATGRDLQLNGKIAWSCFPWLGLQLNDAALSNPPGFSAQTFVHLDQAKIAIKLMPLFHRQIEAGTVSLDGVDVHLIKNAKGVGNWENLIAKKDNDSDNVNLAANDPIPPLPPTQKEMSFKIGAVNVTNSHITWSDQQKKQSYDLNNVEFHSQNIQLGQAFPVQLQFNVQSSSSDLKGKVNVQGLVNVDRQQNIYQINQAKVNSQLTGSSLPNKQLNIAAEGDITSDVKQHTTRGDLQMKTLELGDFTANNINLQFKAFSGQIALNPIQAQLYQGSYQGKVFLLTKNKTLSFESYTELSNIDVQKLLHDLAKITHLQLTGTGNITAKLSSQGNSEATIVKNLQGDGRFALNNGVLNGINVPYWIDAGQAILRKQLPSLPSFPQQTPFGNMTGTFTVTDGVVQNNDLILQGPNLRATGSGSANLNSQQLNYQLNAQLLNRDTASFKGSVIPIKITGSFDHPKIQPELTGILKSQLQDQYEKHKDQIGTQLKKFLGDDKGGKVQQGIEALFGGH